MIDPYTGCTDRPVEPPELDTYTDVCCICDEPLYVHDTRYDFDGDMVCDECVMQYIQRFKVVST